MKTQPHVARMLLMGMLLGAGGLAVAFAPGNADGPEQGRQHPMMKKLDVDGDGAISKDEATRAHAERIAAIDADADGVVSFEEMKAHREAQREQRARARFARLDTDGDGKVSTDEMIAKADRHFERMDKNDDGSISSDEFRGRRGHGDHGHHGGHGERGGSR